MATVIAGGIAAALGGGAIATAAGSIIAGVVVSYAGQFLASIAEVSVAGSAQTSRTNGSTGPQRVILGPALVYGHDMFPPYASDAVNSDPNALEQLFGALAHSPGFGSSPIIANLLAENFADNPGKGRWLTFGIALSDLPVNALRGVVLQDVHFEVGTHLVDNGHAAGLEVPKGLGDEYDSYRNRMYVKFYDGTQTVADPNMLARFWNHPIRPYKEDMIYKGGAYALVTVKWHQNLWTNLSEIGFDVEGVHIDGVFTKNPVKLANYVAEGITMPSGDVVGPRSGFSADSLAAAIQAVEDAGYTGGLEFQVGTPDGDGVDSLDIIESLLEPVAGVAWEDAGQLHVQALDAGAPLFHITDDVILRSKGETAEKVGALADRINAGTITFPNAAERWDTQPSVSYTDTDAVEKDGERLPASFNFPALHDPDQAQAILEMLIADAQETRVHSFALPPSYGYVTRGDKLTWTSEKYFYSVKEFRIESVQRLASYVVVTVRETDPSHFDPDLIVTAPYTVLAVSPTAVADPIPDAAFAGLVATDGGGNDTAAARVSISTYPESAQTVRWQIRKVGDLTTQSGTYAAAELSDTVALSARATTNWEGRAQFVFAGGSSDWSIWQGFVTADVPLGAGALAGEITDAIEDAQSDASKALENAAGLAINLAEQNASEEVEHLRALLEIHTNRERIRDAGIYVDPEDGTVKIEAIDGLEDSFSEVTIELDAQKSALELRATYSDVEAAIAAAALDPSSLADFGDLQLRVSSVEVGLDALEGTAALKADTVTVNGIDTRLTTAETSIDSLNATITQKVDQTDFDAAETRLTSAEQSLSAIDGASIVQTVSDVRHLTETVAADEITTLESLLTQYETRKTLQSDLALATSEFSALVDEDRQAIAQLEETFLAAVGGNSALITEITKSFASETTALAESLSTLSSTVGEQTTAIATQQQTLDGIAAEYTVLIDNNGHVGGLVLRSEIGDSGQTVLDAAFVADRFGIVSTDGSIEYAPFTVYTTPTVVDGVTVPAGVYIDSAVIREASIDSLNIKGGAVTVPVRTQSYLTYKMETADHWVDIVSLSIEADEYATEITAGGDLDNNSDLVETALMRIRVMRDGVQVGPLTGTVSGPSGSRTSWAFNRTDFANDLTGTVTYTLQAQRRVDGSNNGVPRIIYPHFKLHKFKR